MFLGATQFLSYVSYRRFVSITGYKGAGKDLLTSHLVEYYLKRKSKKFGVPYQLISNQDTIWNDPIYDEFGNYLDARASVFWLSEAGMYLRSIKDFRHPYALARKLDCYFFMPSLELSHELLQNFIVEPVGTLQTTLGLTYNPLWYWSVAGHVKGKSVGGLFLWFPEKHLYGIYDTDDLSDQTYLVMDFFNKTVERLQNDKGREYRVVDVADRSDESSISSVYASMAHSMQVIADNTDTSSKRGILQKWLGL